ncbi:unnamed protein product [Orchesella dallaii]|uniref:Uncharacterized protein n=1 Tax=Orchesella dallaii TaxID=48710 RepID=A0ABP1S872_9HEXA
MNVMSANKSPIRIVVESPSNSTPTSSSSSSTSIPTFVTSVQSEKRDVMPSKLQRQAAIRIKGASPTVSFDIPEDPKTLVPRARLTRKPTKYVRK